MDPVSRRLPGAFRGAFLLVPAAALALVVAAVVVRRGAPPGPAVAAAPSPPAPGAPPTGVPSPVPTPPAPPGRSGRPSLRIELRVVDDHGRSSASTAVALRSASGTLLYGRTDDRGRAAFELAGDGWRGEGEAFAGRLEPGRRLWWTRQRIPQEGASPLVLTLTFGPLSEIEGMIVNAQGQRARSAPVRVWLGPRFMPNDPASPIFERLVGAGGEWEFPAPADETGVFRVDHLAADLGIRFDLAAVREDRFLTVSTDLSQDDPQGTPDPYYRAPAPGHYSVVLTRHPAPTLAASALTWDGLPVPQALLSFRLESGRGAGDLGPRKVLKADELGRGKTPLGALLGTVPASPGSVRYWAAAWKKGLGMAYASGVVDFSRPEIRVRFPKTPAGPALQGRVLESQGQPLPRGTEVRITSSVFEEAFLAELRPDSRGGFKLEGLLGPDPAWAATLEHGFHVYAEARARENPAGTGVPQEVHPGVFASIALPRNP